MLDVERTHEKFINHKQEESDLQNLFGVLPTSRVVYYTSKSIESVVYFFYKIKSITGTIKIIGFWPLRAVSLNIALIFCRTEYTFCGVPYQISDSDLIDLY